MTASSWYYQLEIMILCFCSCLRFRKMLNFTSCTRESEPGAIGIKITRIAIFGVLSPWCVVSTTMIQPPALVEGGCCLAFCWSRRGFCRSRHCRCRCSCRCASSTSSGGIMSGSRRCSRTSGRTCSRTRFSSCTRSTSRGFGSCSQSGLCCSSCCRCRIVES